MRKLATKLRFNSLSFFRLKIRLFEHFRIVAFLLKAAESVRLDRAVHWLVPIDRIDRVRLFGKAE